MAYIGKQPVVGNFQVCDAISVVNGQAAYTMQVGSANVEPENANHMLVSLNGILQKPGSSFTISGATITFASNLVTNDVIDFIILLGDTLNVGTPSDDSVGAAQIKNDLISGLTALTSEPADTDEFLISDAGTLKRIDASLVGGGRVLQIINGTNNTSTTTTNTSYTDTSITASITPSSSSNKILVFASVNGAGNVTASKQSYFSLYRDTTARIEWFSISGAAYNYNANSIGYLDSPSSTSALAYNIKIKSESGGTAIVGAYNSYSSLVLMEIKV